MFRYNFKILLCNFIPGYMASVASRNTIKIPNSVDELPSECQSNLPKHFCPACSITFSRNSHLKRHLRTQHGQVFMESPIRGSQCSLWCPLCGERFSSRVHTENHIVAFHQIEICRQTIIFYTEEEFTEWKTKLEREESCSYVSTKGQCRLSNGTFAKYYHCHRCGKYQTTVKGERKRRLKLNGTIKTGTYCPSRIKRATTIIDGAMEITVEYVSTHIGHGKDSESKRKRTRQQLQDENKDRVLKNLQSTVNRTKKVRKSPKRMKILDPSVSVKASVALPVPNLEDELPPVEQPLVTKIADSGDPVIFLYQTQCDEVAQWTEYPERPSQDTMVVVNLEPQKTLPDNLSKRKETFIALLQEAASKVNNVSSEEQFDVLDRFAVALVSHLDSFVVHDQPPQNHVVPDVTYQLLGVPQ